MARNLPPLEIEILGKNFDKVIHALKTVEDSVAALENKAKRVGNVFGTSFDNAGKKVEAATAKIDKAVAASSAKAEKEAKDAAKAVEKNKKEEVKVVEKAEREKQKAIEKTNKAVEKSNAQIAKTTKRALDEEQKSIKKANDERVREEKKTADKIHAARTGMRRTMVGAVGRGIDNTVGRAIRAGAAVGAAGLGAVAVDSVRYRMDNELVAQRISNASKDDKGNRAIDVKDKTGKDGKVIDGLLSFSGKTAQSTGQKQSDILSGFGTIQDITGASGTENAKAAMPALAKLATAQGADIKDLAKMFGNLSMGSAQKSGEDTNAYANRIMGMVRDGVGSSLAAGISLTDIADKGGGLLGTAGNYGGDESANRRSLLSLAQHSYGENGNSAQSFTNARALMSGVGLHAKELGKLGINVLGKDGRVKDVKSTAVDLVAKLGDDQKSWNKTGFDTNAKEALNPLRKIGREAVQKAEEEEAANAAKEGRKVKKFSEKEKEAIRRKALEDDSIGVNKFVAQTDQKTIDDNFDTVRSTNAQKMEAAMESLRIQVGEKLVPAITELIPKIVALIPSIVSLMENMVKLGTWIAENPWKSAFALVGGSIAKEVAIAFAASRITSIISNGFASGMGPSLGTTLGAGLATTIAAAITAGIAGFMAGKALVDGVAGGVKKTDTSQTGKALDNMNLRQKIERGEATDEEKRQYRKNLADMKEQQDKGYTGNAIDGVKKPAQWLSKIMNESLGIDKDVSNVLGGAMNLNPLVLAASLASGGLNSVLQTQADGNNTIVKDEIAAGDALMKLGTLKTADNTSRMVNHLAVISDALTSGGISIGPRETLTSGGD